MYSLGIPNSLT